MGCSNITLASSLVATDFVIEHFIIMAQIEYCYLEFDCSVVRFLFNLMKSGVKIEQDSMKYRAISGYQQLRLKSR